MSGEQPGENPEIEADELQGVPSRRELRDEGVHEARNNEVDRRLGPAPDPWKSFRGVCSGVLILEAISVLLAIPVLGEFAAFAGPSWLPTVLVLGYALLLVLSCGLQSRPWALGWDAGLQLILVAGWLLHPAVGALGILFLLVWGFIWWTQRAVARAQRSS